MLSQNPIAIAEFNRQRRVAGRSFWTGLDFPGKKLMMISLMMSLLVYGGEFVGAVMGAETGWIVNSLGGIPAIITLVVMGVMHFRAQLATLMLASDTIAREKRGGTWESLLLTTLDTRTI